MPKGGQMRWMMGTAGKLIRLACVAAILFGIVSAVYLTDRRSSNLETIEWLPGWLRGAAHWADYHGRFRNVPAYGLLSVPVLVLFTTTRNRGRAVGALAVFATAMEFTQLFIPTRFFDGLDIIESWLGIVIVWVVVELAYIGSRLAHGATMTRQPQPRDAFPRPKPRLPIPRPAND